MHAVMSRVRGLAHVANERNDQRRAGADAQQRKHQMLGVAVRQAFDSHQQQQHARHEMVERTGEFDFFRGMEVDGVFGH